jgi:HSP20 family molecular chaperone IbpA
MRNGAYFDLNQVIDDIFDGVQSVGEELKRNFNQDTFFGPHGGRAFHDFCGGYNENTDYYPAYSYPPMNVYMAADKSMCFEFALAGFDEKDISLSFQGDYMVFSAQLPPKDETAAVKADDLRWFKRRLKMKDIEKQKYYVPLDKYAQDKVKAVFKNGILKVTVPPKEEPDHDNGIKVEIVTDSN